ncbi:MAG TPA: hypothetical protein VNJ12_11075 [Candidatus Dormibacteraeota bacterium]|nr:hypothetical protein [Candidatus Dormibacteraeota bacterium]
MRAKRNGFLGLTLAVLATVCVAGCSKSSQSPAAPNFTQQSDSSAPSAPTSGASAASSQDQPAASQPYNQPAPAPAPQPVSIRIPAGTDLHVVLDQPISSATAQSGDSFSATLVRPVSVRGQRVIPRDARVTGQVVEARASGRLAGEARLVLTLDSVRIGGRRYNLQTSSIARVGASHKKRDIIAIGGGTALGAIIGGIAGGGKGAAIGAAAGAGAGTAGAAVTGKRNVVLPAEASLAFRLVAPLVVQQ